MRCWVRSRFGRPLDMVVTPCPLPLLFMGSPSPRSDGEVLSVQLACVSLRRPSLTRGTQQIFDDLPCQAKGKEISSPRYGLRPRGRVALPPSGCESLKDLTLSLTLTQLPKRGAGIFTSFPFDTGRMV